MLFEKLNKSDKPLARLRKKWEDPNKIRNEKGDIATVTEETVTLRATVSNHMPRNWKI